MQAIVSCSIALALVTVAPACTVAKADVDVENLCVPYDDVGITGVAPGTTTLDHQFDFKKLSVFQSLAASVTDLQFVSMSADATSGVPSLDFIQAAHVDVASGNPDSNLPTLDVYDCSGDCVPDGNSLSVPSMFQGSALAYIDSGSILVDLALAGPLPTDDWTIDISLCFRGELRYSQSL